ncbi:MAG: GNAT family N-acetyltransferase [Nanoarchaeota archaeon]|nr:GNAT family N-acetyltransferase [Nanoarchaeota archaeon]
MRPAKASDAEGIAKVLKASYNLDTTDDAREAFLRERKQGRHFIVADINGKIAGFVSWYMHGLSKHGLVELDRIAVLPEYQGKGVSGHLFSALVDDAQNAYKKEGCRFRKLFLLTHESNKRAHAFYEKMGMKHETSLKSHYYDGEDERVYGMFF